MDRICTSLAENGYQVTLVGRKLGHSPALADKKFRQKRLRCFFNKGKWFYAEYNIRLFLYLLFKKMDAVCAIDLDTILPCLYASKWKKIPRIYDAHELFTGLKEVETRPSIKKIWSWVERTSVPRFKWGYTVSESIADEFNRRYGVEYEVIRNMSRLREITEIPADDRFLLYQGAVNEARAFEQLIPAMREIPCRLVICGDGNFMPQLKTLISLHDVGHKVELKGMLAPEDLWRVSQTATIGLGVAENTGINQYFALPNKFFDYIHAGIPQVAMAFPEYLRVNAIYEVAVLLTDSSPALISASVNKLLTDAVLYDRLRQNCLRARLVLNWQREEQKLLDFYHKVFHR